MARPSFIETQYYTLISIKDFLKAFPSGFHTKIVLATLCMTEGSEFESRYDQECSLLHVVQTGYGVHPISYPMGTAGSFPGVKRPGREADHLPPTSAEVKKTWIYTCAPPYAFKA
jgi:hypothetical protein